MESLKINCPLCREEVLLHPQGATCKKGHKFSIKNDVYQIITPAYAAKLYPFLEAFDTFENPNIPIVDPKRYPELPFVEFQPEVWSLRQIDLKLIKKYIKSSDQRALEIGAWNGWLTHHLARVGLNTVAVDHFTNETTGLGSKKFYSEDWIALQMDVENMDIITEKFDLIIINRCLNYFTSPQRSVEQLKTLLAPGGRLIITGMTLIRDPSETIKKLKEAAKSFEKTYNTPFFFKEYRGYLTREDCNILKNKGLQVYFYKELKLRSFLGKLFSNRPIYYYGIFEADDA